MQGLTTTMHNGTRRFNTMKPNTNSRNQGAELMLLENMPEFTAVQRLIRHKVTFFSMIFQQIVSHSSFRSLAILSPSRLHDCFRVSCLSERVHNLKMVRPPI